MSQSINRRCVFGFATFILSLFVANAAYAQASLSMSLAVSPISTATLPTRPPLPIPARWMLRTSP